MNLPNKLTMSRIIMIPLLILVYLIRSVIPNAYLWVMGIIFLLASLTDYFDGAIARKRNIVTTFGKFMDPLADKLLVLTALLILVDNHTYVPQMWMPFWFVVIILARELIVTSIRLVAVGEGKVIAASNLGKFKTGSTMVAILWYLFLMVLNLPFINIVGWVLMGIALLFTIISGVDYFWKNRKLIFQSI